MIWKIKEVQFPPNEYLRWFAWYPVSTMDGYFCWLSFVYRIHPEKKYPNSYHMFVTTDYSDWMYYKEKPN